MDLDILVKLTQQTPKTLPHSSQNSSPTSIYQAAITMKNGLET
jgi:hypothetical protein